MDKSEIRAVMRQQRKSLSSDAREYGARTLCATILADARFRSMINDCAEGGGALAVYLASPDEIDVSRVIEAALHRHVTVVSPRWNGEHYELAKLKSLCEVDLRPGPMGILEPKDREIVMPENVAFWLVPGLAFTRDGKRLGYGGGWYDRLMANAHPHAQKFGIGYAFQILDDLPTASHDIRLDGVFAIEEVFV